MEAIQNKTTNKIVGIKNAGWVIICAALSLQFVYITFYWEIQLIL